MYKRKPLNTFKWKVSGVHKPACILMYYKYLNMGENYQGFANENISSVNPLV